MNMMVKLYPGNPNHASDMGRWLSAQHAKGYAFRSGISGVVNLKKTDPQKANYVLKPYIKKRGVGVPSDANRIDSGWEYAGEIRGLITRYRVYRNNDLNQAMCPDSDLQWRLSEKAWTVRRIAYGGICSLLIWFLAATLVYLFTPLNEFATLRDVLFELHRIGETSVTPFFMWMLRAQWSIVALLAILLILCIVHCVMSLYYTFKKETKLRLYFPRTIAILMVSVFAIALLCAFGSSAGYTREIPDGIESLCAALEIGPEEPCYIEEGNSLLSKYYRNISCSYVISSPSLWNFEYTLRTERQTRRVLDRYLEEIDGTKYTTLEKNGETWVIYEGNLWTKQSRGCSACSVKGTQLRIIHYVGDLSIGEFASTFAIIPTI